MGHNKTKVQAQSAVGKGIEFNATAENLDLLMGKMGLSPSVVVDGEGFLTPDDYAAYGSLIPDIAGDMPWGKSGYLEDEELGYLRKVIEKVTASRFRPDEVALRLQGLKDLLKHECWGATAAYSNLFRRVYLGSGYQADDGRWVAGRTFAGVKLDKNNPFLPPYEKCRYDDIPEAFNGDNPLFEKAPVPLTAVENFECMDVEYSLLRVMYIHDVCNKEDHDLISGSAIVIHREYGLVLTARHVFGHRVDGVKEIVFQGAGGDFKVPIGDIEVATPEGDADWMVLRLKDPAVLEGYKSLPFAPPLTEEDRFRPYYGMGYAYYIGDGREAYISSATRMSRLDESYYIGKVIGGMSGGPVVNHECKLTAVNVSTRQGVHLSNALDVTPLEVFLAMKAGFQPLGSFIQPANLKCGD